jgi:hypothetical protein
LDVSGEFSCNGFPNFTQLYSSSRNSPIGLNTAGSTGDIYTFTSAGVYLIWICEQGNTTTNTSGNSGMSATTDNFTWLGYVICSSSSGYNIFISRLFGSEVYIKPVVGTAYNKMKIQVVSNLPTGLRNFYIWAQKIF